MSDDQALPALLAGLTPQRRPGEYVFVVADQDAVLAEHEIMASVMEREGRSIVIERRAADAAGLVYDYVAGWITLEVRSALDAVGLTAAVATALTGAGLSCNVVAGFHHDHLLVPHDRVEEAIDVLNRLSQGLADGAGDDHGRWGASRQQLKQKPSGREPAGPRRSSHLGEWHTRARDQLLFAYYLSTRTARRTHTVDQSHPRPPAENSGQSSEQPVDPDQHGLDGPAGDQPGGSDHDGPDPSLDPRISEHVSRLLAAEGATEGSPQPSDVLHPSEPSILTFMRSAHESPAPPPAERAHPQPTPAPMPADVAERIGAALAAEARLRVDPGPLRAAGTGATTHPTGSTNATAFDNTDSAGAPHTVIPFSRPGRPGSGRSTWMAVGAVAAAAAVIATGGSLLHLNKRTAAAASLTDPTSGTRPQGAQNGGGAPTPTPLPAGQGQSGTPKLHIQLSTTSYAAGNLAEQARDLLDRPGPEIGSTSAEAPSIGPIATPVGLASCLRALPPADGSPVSAVSVDLASYNSAPAAIVVVTRDSISSAWVVERSCSQNDPHVIKAATPVP